MPEVKNLKKHNPYISYIKGWAIISVILIHLLDWSEMGQPKGLQPFKELLYPSVLFFIANAGSVIYLAYSGYDSLKKPTLRLIQRGLELIGVYFLYTLIKFYIFNFGQEPFYQQFIGQGKFSLTHLLTLQSYSVPISIILTIGAFLIISPLLLWLVRKTKYPKSLIGVLIALVLIFNYVLPLPQNTLTNFLYSKNLILFPLLLWLLPFLMGFYLALDGMDKHKRRYLIIFGFLTAGFYFYLSGQGAWLRPSGYMYPLRLYYIFYSFTLIYLLFYLFTWLKKFNGKLLKYVLATLRALGDYTLSLYVLHWVVIDLILWIFYPKGYFIWPGVILLLAVFIGWRRERIKQYLALD
ncbi:MAG: acyltransferase family protein [Patescibacteria group bacterium]